MKIRTIKRSDFDSIIELWNKINVQPESIIKDKDNFIEMVKLNPDTCFVIEENGEIIGSIFGLYNGRRAWIHHLGVHPHWQKKKLGTKLLKKTEEALKAKGAKRLLLSVDFNNLSVSPFYLSKGYTVTSDAIMFGKNI